MSFDSKKITVPSSLFIDVSLFGSKLFPFPLCLQDVYENFFSYYHHHHHHHHHQVNSLKTYFLNMQSSLTRVFHNINPLFEIVQNKFLSHNFSL